MNEEKEMKEYFDKMICPACQEIDEHCECCDQNCSLCNCDVEEGENDFYCFTHDCAVRRILR